MRAWGVEFDAVVLAGGGGRRLGGVDKGALDVAGLALLDRVLTASAAARNTVVVGERRPTVRDVVWTREDPPDGGPLAGLAAGLAALTALTELTQPTEPALPTELAVSTELPAVDDGIVLVLATDLPWLRAADVDRLLAALARDPTAQAAMFSDPQGRRQPLAGTYRTAPIRAAVAAVEPVHGKAVKLVVHQLAAVVTVPDLGAAGDCDTPDQLAAARAYFDRQG